MELYSYPHNYQFVVGAGRLFLIKTWEYNYQDIGLSIPLSRNQKYINWLLMNQNILQDMFDAGIWFISDEHTNDHKVKKYLAELKAAIAELNKMEDPKEK